MRSPSIFKTAAGCKRKNRFFKQFQTDARDQTGMSLKTPCGSGTKRRSFTAHGVNRCRRRLRHRRHHRLRHRCRRRTAAIAGVAGMIRCRTMAHALQLNGFRRRRRHVTAVAQKLPRPIDRRRSAPVLRRLPLLSTQPDQQSAADRDCESPYLARHRYLHAQCDETAALCAAKTPAPAHIGRQMWRPRSLIIQAKYGTFAATDRFIRCPCSNEKGEAMRKTLMALAAVATLAVSAWRARAGPCPARSWRGDRRRNDRRRHRRRRDRRPRLLRLWPRLLRPRLRLLRRPGLCRRDPAMAVAVTGSASVSGTAMAGGFAACGFAAELRSSSLNQHHVPETARFRERFAKMA